MANAVESPLTHHDCDVGGIIRGGCRGHLPQKRNHDEYSELTQLSEHVLR